MSYPLFVQRMIESIERQGATLVAIDFDPSGGLANAGYLFIAALKDNLVFINSGSLMRADYDDLKWAMMIGDSMTVEEWEKERGPIAAQRNAV